MSRSKNYSVYENLDTSFVNLGALLRYLEQRDFTGRIQLEMGDYEAQIRLRKGARAQILERDKATGREGEGEAALKRLLVRALDGGGRINVYREEESPGAESFAEPWREGAAAQERAGHEASDEATDWQGLLRASADLIASVERAAHSTGADFGALFSRARLELADDYAFLDPNAGSFVYANNEIELNANLSERAFVSGVCETLRRVVEKIAGGRRSESVRERVALELAVLARRRQRQLTEFGIMPQLDRIAGTRVI
jgi:hypothetical protein